MKTVLLITLKSKYGVLVKMSHFFRYTWDKFDHVLDHHFKTIKAMKVKFCIPVKVIGIHILTINKEYKKLHFLRYLKKKKKLLYFLNYPVADKLAKEAAAEAESMPEVTNVISNEDIKRAVKESCKQKWQRRWEAADTGRHLFQYRPLVSTKSYCVQNVSAQRLISQLRTGYCHLNEYQCKLGNRDSTFCECGEPETVSHFIEDCSRFEDIRERLRVRLRQETGIMEFSARLFLGTIKDKNEKIFEEQINSILELYIQETKRFEKTLKNNPN